MTKTKNARKSMIYESMLSFCLNNWSKFEEETAFKIYHADLTKLKKAYWLEVEAKKLLCEVENVQD